MSFLGALVGGVTSLLGMNSAANAAEDQLKYAKKRDKQVRADFAPYREAGVNYLGDLDTAYGGGDPATLEARRAEFQTGFENSPLYKNVFMPALETSTNNYNRFASSTGQLNSGGTLKALQDRAAKLGQQTFGDYIAGITGRADQGQAAAAGTVMGTNPAFQAGQGALGAKGDAMTAGVLGVGNAITGGINNANYLKSLSSFATPQLSGATAGLWAG